MSVEDAIVVEPVSSESNEEGGSESRALQDPTVDSSSVQIEDMPADPAEMSSNYDDLEEQTIDSLPQSHLLIPDEQEK